MTFTEAAVEVLRLVGKPLHYKKITEVAIERNMLSHVGKTPEVTMSSRLATMVKRDRGDAPVIKVKPGVFGLRDFSEEQLADLSGDIDELPEVEVENEENEVAEAAEGEAVQAKPEPRKPLPGAEVFPEEDDDDEPILGGDDDDEDEEGGEGAEAGEGAASAESRSQRKRKRKRRRGRSGDEGEDRFEPSRSTSSASSSNNNNTGSNDEPRADTRERDDRNRGEREERSRERSRDGRRDRDDRNRDREEPRRARDDRGRDERRERERDDRSRDRDRDRDRDRERGGDRDESSYDSNREPGDGDLLGKDLADAVASVLGTSGPRGLPAYRVADQLVRRGRLSGDPNALVPTVMASVRADIARKKIDGQRVRFRVEAGTLTLTDFLLPQDVTRAELEVLRAAERQRERARRAFLRYVGDLSGAGLAELIATWLNAEGVVGLRAVRRPGAGSGELHLAGTLRRGVEETRIAVVVCRDARELGRERVIEARGALHYYGHASTTWLITLGQVLSGAKEEAAAPAAAPVTLFDGMALAGAMERTGVGLSVQYVAVSALDFELLDSLRGGTPREERRDERRDDRRDRDRDRDRERNGRDRDRERLERPRLTYQEELATAAVEELDAVEIIENEAPPAREPTESEEGAATEAGASAPETANGDAREGGRRRRRRRRRKGGRDRQEGTQGAAGEGAAEAGDDDGDEDGEPGEPGSDGDAEAASENSDVAARPHEEPAHGQEWATTDDEEAVADLESDDDEDDDEEESTSDEDEFSERDREEDV
jgi:hypothetical protein